MYRSRTLSTSIVSALTSFGALPNEPETVADNSVTSLNLSTEEQPLNAQVSNPLDTPKPPEQTSSFSMTGSLQENNSDSLKQRIAESLNNDERRFSPGLSRYASRYFIRLLDIFDKLFADFSFLSFVRSMSFIGFITSIADSSIIEGKSEKALLV